jgi:hypothetical protein
VNGIDPSGQSPLTEAVLTSAGRIIIATAIIVGVSYGGYKARQGFIYARNRMQAAQFTSQAVAFADTDRLPTVRRALASMFAEYTSPNMDNLLDEIDHINIWVLPAGAPAGSVAPSRGNVYIPADAVNFVGQNRDIVLGMFIFGEYQHQLYTGFGTLSEAEAQGEWELARQILRRNGIEEPLIENYNHEIHIR